YPHASQFSRDGLARMLMNFDKPWAGGNGDERVNRSELATAGLLLGVLAGTDFSHEISLPGADPKNQLVVEQLHTKINQQLFRRVNQLEYSKLPESDVQLEWMQFTLRGYLTDKLTHAYAKDTGQLPPDVQAAALSQFGPDQAGHWQKLRELYDHALMGGD